MEHMTTLPRANRVDPQVSIYVLATRSFRCTCMCKTFELVLFADLVNEFILTNDFCVLFRLV